METREIRIEPVTRVEGHAKVTIFLRGEKIEKIQLNIIEPPRFFEKLVENKPAEEAPRITERICGICYASHHLASVKAVETAWGVSPPKAAVNLRRLLNAGQHVASHILHLAFLALPDLLDIKDRNFVEASKRNPELVESAFKLHEYGLKVMKSVGGREIHPVTAIPGGMSKPLSGEDRDALLRGSDEAIQIAEEIASFLFNALEERGELVREFPSNKTYYMSLTSDGTHEIYDGLLTVVNPEGKLKLKFPPNEYLDHVAEKAVPHSYVKYPFLKEFGYPDGLYRVGPLARLNVAKEIAMPKAFKYLCSFKKSFGDPAHNVLAYNAARAVELVHATEMVKAILKDPSIESDDVLVEPVPREGNGVGIVEAPRGVLIHHYRVNKDGLIERGNFIVATGQNVPLIELDIMSFMGKRRLNPDLTEEELLWKVETLVRAYDPCISCATHIVELKRLS
ncbi:TPA: Ni/Fe hydrogenase subunit alpha [Candidatus Bathyarchaeota archaeon]|nr:Ni/Fe hydrogenase subunit alpha [Candidatus Bathyarchaeota archaeon]